MLKRSLMICAALLLVSACSSTGDETVVGDQPTLDSTYQNGANGGVGGTDGYGAGGAGSYEAGSVEEFVNAIGDRVYFSTDSYDLTMEARSTLDAQAGWLMKYPNVNVTVEGHADERGTREYNLALGERRANSIESYLTAFGIDARRINTISYGKERPAIAGATDDAWNQNRRGVTKID